jgi:hypothetical protein
MVVARAFASTMLPRIEVMGLHPSKAGMSGSSTLTISRTVVCALQGRVVVAVFKVLVELLVEFDAVVGVMLDTTSLDCVSWGIMVLVRGLGGSGSDCRREQHDVAKSRHIRQEAMLSIKKIKTSARKPRKEQLGKREAEAGQELLSKEKVLSDSSPAQERPFNMRLLRLCEPSALS